MKDEGRENKSSVVLANEENGRLSSLDRYEVLRWSIVIFAGVAVSLLLLFLFLLSASAQTTMDDTRGTKDATGSRLSSIVYHPSSYDLIITLDPSPIEPFDLCVRLTDQGWAAQWQLERIENKWVNVITAEKQHKSGEFQVEYILGYSEIRIQLFFEPTDEKPHWALFLREAKKAIKRIR